MRTSAKLSGEERREAIIKAVRRVFAEKGFDGTTTRKLAEAAGVSEALLFKHFPSKEALFTAMQLSCCSEQDQEKIERLQALEPSASTLVGIVYFLVSRVIDGCSSLRGERDIQNRLMLRSLAEDGEFTRLLYHCLATSWVPQVEECVRSAVASGEAIGGPVHPTLGAWFIHHLAAMITCHLLPASAVVEYGVTRDRLVEQAVWFALRGVGLKEEAIWRYYNPKELTKLGI